MRPPSADASACRADRVGPMRSGAVASSRNGATCAAALLWIASLGTLAAHATPVTLSVASPGGAPMTSVAVILEPATPPPAASGRRSSIDQLNRRFTPQLSIVQVGTAVDFPNSDNVRHHVYSFSPAKTFDLKLYAGRGAPPVTFDRPGLVVLGCNIHDSMVAFIVVTPSPHFGLTGDDGRVALDVPPGRYVLRVWSPTLDAAPPRRTLVVGATPLAESVTATPAARPDQVPAWED